MTDQKTIAQLLAENEKRLRDIIANAEKEAKILTDFAKNWPVDRLITRVHHNTIASDILGYMTVRAEAQGRTNALAYLAAFPLEPLVYIKGTFTSVRAKAWLREKDIEQADTIIDALGAYWRWNDYDHAVLCAFTVVGGVRINIQIKIIADGAYRNIDHDMHGRVTSWTLRSAPGGESIIYAGSDGKHAGDVVIYFPAEPGGGAPDFQYYMEHTRPVEWRSRIDT